MSTVPKLPAYDDEAACRTVGFGAYFGSRGMTTPGLRQVCEGCVWLDPCREYAIYHEVMGFWGGLTNNQRKGIRKQRGITPVPIDSGGPQQSHQDGVA